MSGNNLPPRGTGRASAHHGEILQGAFHDDAGRLRRALVTLRNPHCESQAIFYLHITCEGVSYPSEMSKAYRAAAFAMANFATGPPTATDGYIEINSTVPRGIGMGSSTADVTAVIRAVADFYDARPSADEIGRLAVRAEGASDPLMIDNRVVLFAQRDGVVLETLGRSLPEMVVVGCNADPGVSGIDTVALRLAAYTSDDIETFRFLRAELRAAVNTGDVARLGQVATVSALISQRFLPKAALEFLLDVCRSCGGCGLQVAHSGTVAGVIFDPRRPEVRKGVEHCIARLEKAGLPLTSIIGPVPDVSPPGVPPACAAPAHSTMKLRVGLPGAELRSGSTRLAPESAPGSLPAGFR
jgi:uncharacterized protein involved in propanediol utilization